MRVEFEQSPPAAYDAANDAANDAASEGTQGAEIVVLKFGSSVLRTRDDLPAVASEIYRHAREGRKVVAVVSALAGETDALIAEAAAAGAGALSRHAPRLISLGEERSAALLAITCETIGLDARILGARAISLRAGGPVNDAEPVGVDAEALRSELARRDVVITPGFVALGAAGEPVLLGRGGSDLTAVFLAAALGLSETTLMKDVDGVYDRDPAIAGASALRYRRLDWQGARDVAGRLLQPKAIDFAAAHKIAIRVLRLNGEDGTLISSRAAPPSPAKRSARLRVAVAGLGLIGEGAALRLSRANPDYELCAALVREPFRERPFLPIGQVTNDLTAFLSTRPDVVIDALPDGAAGRALIRAALARGVSIVTANKQAIAGAMAEFDALAEESGASFAFSPSVGGGAPLLEAVLRAGGAARSIEAALNGTVNFILTSLAQGGSFAEAVKAAQLAGFAEPDPSADLSGADARAKLAILSYAAFGREIDLEAIEVEALDAEKAARFAAAGGSWKQLARLERRDDGALAASVRFERRDDDPLFAGALWEANALRLRLEDGRVIECRGKGAGRRPTVESILADLADVRRKLTGRASAETALAKEAVSA